MWHLQSNYGPADRSDPNSPDVWETISEHETEAEAKAAYDAETMGYPDKDIRIQWFPVGWGHV